MSTSDIDADRKKVLREAQAALRKSAPQVSLKNLVTTQRSVADVTNRFSEMIRRKHSMNIDRVMRIASACPPALEEACITFEDAPPLMTRTGSFSASFGPGVASSGGGGGGAATAAGDDGSSSRSSGANGEASNRSVALAGGGEASMSRSNSMNIASGAPPRDGSLSLHALQALIGSKRQRVAAEATDESLCSRPGGESHTTSAIKSEEELHLENLKKKHARRRLNLDVVVMEQTATTALTSPTTTTTPSSSTLKQSSNTTLVVSPQSGLQTPSSSTTLSAAAASFATSAPSLLLGLNLDKRSGAAAQVEALIRQTSVADADKLRRQNSFEQTSARVVVFESAGRLKAPTTPTSTAGASRTLAQ